MTAMTPAVRAILANYESDNPGTKANLARILMQGRLGGTGKLVILPVDQGFEHGPARSFAPNPDAYDPHYHYQLAIDAGLSAYAAPLGMIEAGADTFAGQIPTILKVNSSNSWSTSINQAVTGTVDDALRLGCSAIGFTIYPGSDDIFELMEEIRELSQEAKAVGIATVIWSYPRGGEISKAGELALDVGAYAAHMAALAGAHIIKVKLPTDHIEQKDAKKAYEGGDWSTQTKRVAHVVKACFNGRRIVVFSGGAAKGRTPSIRTPATSATAAAMAQSSGATPSSGHGPRRWRCSTRSSGFIRGLSEVGFPRDLLAVALFSAGLACADPSTACSMSSGYKVPTNLQLAAKADTIVIAVVEGERTSSQLWSGSIIARPLVLIKGSALPESVEIQGATIANNPQMLSMVVPSAPRELRAPNPGALMGACVRYVFSKGMNLVLFLKRDKSGNLIPYRSAFSRDAEDVVDENALWAKAVREYASISVAPQQQWRTLLRNRITTLRANAADPDAQAIANDMVVELSAKRQPPYD